MKQLWLLVGGNGAGKSTFYRLVLEPLGLPFVNADRLARLVYPEAPEARSYEAALLAEQQRNTLLLSGASFCFETMYSHPSKINFVARVKALGYAVIMVVIHLERSELNAARIAHRVREGGRKAHRKAAPAHPTDAGSGASVDPVVRSGAGARQFISRRSFSARVDDPRGQGGDSSTPLTVLGCQNAERVIRAYSVAVCAVEGQAKPPYSSSNEIKSRARLALKSEGSSWCRSWTRLH